MKMSSETYDKIETAIRRLEGARDMEATRSEYRNGQFPRADKVQDLEKRFRWDLFWASGAISEVRDALRSEDLNDDHLDTALRRIVEPLGVAS